MVAMMFSYFSYAAGTAVPAVIDVGLVGIALALAPFVFVIVAFVSRNPRAPKRVLIAMGLLLGLGFALGLISPILGAAAGFGVGFALTLNPLDVDKLMRNRLLAVLFASVYMLVLLLVAEPAAGVMTGALLPPMLVGLADEYTVWAASRSKS
jgi:hypothetical protein